LFQSDGAPTQKALSPNVRSLDLGTLRCKYMERFVCQEEDFIFDPRFNWQPMKLLYDGSDVR